MGDSAPFVVALFIGGRCLLPRSVGAWPVKVASPRRAFVVVVLCLSDVVAVAAGSLTVVVGVAVGVDGDIGVASGFGDPSTMRTVSGNVGVASGFGDPSNMRTVNGNVGVASGFGDPSNMRTVGGVVGVASGFGDPSNMRTCVCGRSSLINWEVVKTSAFVAQGGQ